MPSKLIFSLCVVGAFSPPNGLAHHSRAPYDMTKEVVFEGTITKLDWKNPHILLSIETRDADGTVMVQEIEASAVSQMRLLGLQRETLEPGTEVVVRAWPGRRGAGARALGIDVRTNDGAVHALNVDSGVSIAASVPAQTLAGQWAPTFESTIRIISSFPDPMLLTEAGRAAREQTTARVRTPGVAAFGICEPFPSLALSIGPDLRTIERRDDTVVMKFETEGMNQQRIVHLNQAAHPADVTPSLLGHSIGRWEGDTLVIDTIAFTAHPLGIVQLPSTPTTRLVERLSLTADRRQLEYVFTVEDAVHLTGRASYAVKWDHRPDVAPSSAEPCDPDNARRALVE